MLLLTVSQVNMHLRALLEADDLLCDLWVQGEISNLKHAASGHYYFTLKDDAAAIDVAMWRSYASRLEEPLRNGDAVLAHGRVSIYEAGGRLQLYVDTVRPAGVGLLHARFEELKARLSDEGLFDEGRKRPLPDLPQRIGVAASEQSAAWQDIQKVLRRRYPLVEVLLAPCLVQGEQSPASIVRALHALYRSNVDLIILARGGGSLEDLWSFNDEAVARAVFASPVPLITGVGHETDTTIVDYVADLRAPTPSAAAELAVPDGAALLNDVAALRQQLDEALAEQLASERRRLSTTARALQRLQPTARTSQARQQVDELLRRAGERARHAVEVRRLRRDGLAERLAALSPAATLRRGYAVVRQHDGAQAVVTRAEQVQPGEVLAVMLAQGRLRVTVEQAEQATDILTEAQPEAPGTTEKEEANDER
jgi:exodeoxyribonuclease VII large subunit